MEHTQRVDTLNKVFVPKADGGVLDKSGAVDFAIGEFCYRGSVDDAEAARRERLVPMGIAKGCRLERDVKRDTPISYDMVSIGTESVVLQLRRIQDQLYLVDEVQRQDGVSVARSVHGSHRP